MARHLHACRFGDRFACLLWLVFLAWGNVRSRRAEIGILRAIGMRRQHVLGLLTGKAVLIGLVGSVVGSLAGALGASAWAEAEPDVDAAAFDPVLVSVTVLVAVALSVIATWLPAVVAAAEDPVTALSED